jgi:hypothetical protein
MMHVRQIDHHAGVGMLQRVEQIMRAREGIGAAKGDNPRQCLQRPIVTFRIDDTYRISVKNELLGEQPRNPGLPGARITGDEHIPAADGKREGNALVRMSEQEPSPGRPDHG